MLTYTELLDFIQERMRMSHIYQPLLIRSLVEVGGKATLRQLATAFLQRDEPQLRYWEDRIRKMPLPVLQRRGVVAREGDLIALNAPPLTFQERTEVEMACDRKLGEFLSQRGLGVWDYRLIDSPVPTDVRYQVLKKAGGTCECCGATAKETRLEVDHVIPRSQGGSSDISNLQVLCATCNQGKSNRDRTDFRRG